MTKDRFRLIMTLLALFIVLEVILIIAYPAMNTHTDKFTIRRIETWGDKLYHIRVTRSRLHLGTDEMILNVSRYFYDDLLLGHTYRIKWVDGLMIDRILEFEELS